MLAFGVIGYALRHYGYPMAPLVLGIVLGDLLEKNLRRALVLSDGDLTPFFTRPIAGSLALMIAAVVGWKLWAPGGGRQRHETALCNEVLRHLDFDAQCVRAAALGCAGLEVAPFTVGSSAADWQLASAQQLRRQAADNGIRISSLHWLLVQPKVCRCRQRIRPCLPEPSICCAADRFCCGLRRAGAGAWFAETAFAGARAKPGRRARTLHRRLGATGRTCRTGRRHLLHRAALAVRDATDQ